MKLKPNQIVIEVSDTGDLTTVHVERDEPIDPYALEVLMAVVAMQQERQKPTDEHIKEVVR